MFSCRYALTSSWNALSPTPTVATDCLFSIWIFQKHHFCCCYLGGRHTQQCSGVPCDCALKDQSWRWLGKHMGCQGIKLRLATYKATLLCYHNSCWNGYDFCHSYREHRLISGESPRTGWGFLSTSRERRFKPPRETTSSSPMTILRFSVDLSVCDFCSTKIHFSFPLLVSISQLDTVYDASIYSGMILTMKDEDKDHVPKADQGWRENSKDWAQTLQSWRCTTWSLRNLLAATQLGGALRGGSHQTKVHPPTWIRFAPANSMKTLLFGLTLSPTESIPHNHQSMYVAFPMALLHHSSTVLCRDINLTNLQVCHYVGCYHQDMQMWPWVKFIF